MNHEAMNTISVFQVKFALIGIHQFGNEFFLTRMSLKENKHTLSERMEKEKSHFRVNCQ